MSLLYASDPSSTSMSQSGTTKLVGARAKARAWAGAEVGAEVGAEAGAFLSGPNVATEELFFEEAEAAVAEEDWTTSAVKLVAAICGRLEHKVEEDEEKEEEGEKEEEDEEEEEGTAFMPLRLGPTAPEKFREQPWLFIRNKSSVFFLKGFTPGRAGLLCIKARKSTSVIVGKRQEEAAAEIAE